jgi:hypothetical protein
VTFVAAGGSIRGRATFIDTKTLELCTLLPNNLLNNCDNLAIDRPTLH